MIGRTVSHYRITAELGRGGMGVVYKAEDIQLRRTVALKFLSPHLLAEPSEKARFLHEAQAAAALDHNNIATIHEIHEVDGQTFMVMAFIEGEELGAKIAADGMAVDEALDIAVQVARGLAKAHEAGIVHRDVKPNNVIITGDGVAKVVDFGLAKLATQTTLTKTGVTLGTVTYMSPEQATSAGVDHRTDIWSLGVMLYQMLAGMPPFRGDVEAAVIYAILNRNPKPITEIRKDVPVALEDILEKALAKDPAKRFETMGAFLAALETLRDQLRAGVTERKFTLIRKLRRRRRLLGGITAVLVIGIAAIVGRAMIVNSQVIDSVAVLPFANLSGDPGQEYYSDGMTVALINELGKIGALKVISHTSAMQFKHTDKSLPEIARELNVDAIIESSVLREGDSVRVTAQLVRADPEQQLWADSYTRDAANVLALHSQVARAIAEHIQVTVTPQEQQQLARARPVDPEAYEAYLIGRSLVAKGSMDEVERGIGYLQQALERDPNYAPAYAGLATAYVSSAGTGGGWRSPVEVMDKARAAAERALELDESLAEAHLALSMVSAEFDWDIPRSEREVGRAIELDPGFADARIIKTYLLIGRGRYDEALEQAKRAVRMDPLNLLGRAQLISSYLHLGDSARVYEESQKLIDINPDPLVKSLAILTKAIMASHAGREKEAVAGFEQAVELTGRQHADWLTFLGVAYAMAGRHEDAVGILNEMTALARTRYVSPVLFAQLHASMGHIDAAFEALEHAYELRCGYLYEVLAHPFISDPQSSLKRNLGSDPRWDDLVKRVGLPYQEPLS